MEPNVSFVGLLGVTKQPKENTMKAKNKLTVMACAALLLLAACGSSQGDRALSGAGIGAGVGAVGAPVTSGNPVAGGVIGGAVGAAAGGLTKEKDVDLGKPVWR
jgi:osmotically inducible lipoprotein OsmB